MIKDLFAIIGLGFVVFHIYKFLAKIFKSVMRQSMLEKIHETGNYFIKDFTNNKWRPQLIPKLDDVINKPYEKYYFSSLDIYDFTYKYNEFGEYGELIISWEKSIDKWCLSHRIGYSENERILDYFYVYSLPTALKEGDKMIDLIGKGENKTTNEVFAIIKQEYLSNN